MTPHQQGCAGVFISYSHQDSAWLERLRTHLKPLERDFKADIWDDTLIKTGSRWREEIERALDRASVAILLVSANFLASDFITGNELPPLLKAAKERGTVIIPLIISSSGYLRHKELSQLQASNTPSKPLLNMSRGQQEAALERVAGRVAALIGAPSTGARRKSNSRKSKRSKKSTGGLRDEQLRDEQLNAGAACAQKGEVEMNVSIPLQAGISDRELPLARLRGKLGYWHVFTAICITIMVISIVIATRQPNKRANGRFPQINPVLVPSVAHSAQSDANQDLSNWIEVTIEKGETSKIFNDRLRIQFDSATLDKASNNYIVAFTLSAPNAETARVLDARVGDRRKYTYPAGSNITVQLISAEENLAVFRIEEAKKKP
jgi:hypothetical protein